MRRQGADAGRFLSLPSSQGTWEVVLHTHLPGAGGGGTKARREQGSTREVGPGRMAVNGRGGGPHREGGATEEVMLGLRAPSLPPPEAGYGEACPENC